MDRPAFFRIPGLLFRLLLGEASELVLEGQRVKSVRLQELGFEFKHPTLKKALEDLLQGVKKY